MGNLTEVEIDQIVIAEAENDHAWETPIRVNGKGVLPFRFPRPTEISAENDVMSGEPVFRGTRVPVSALIDNLEADVSLNEFLHEFPTVKREQAIQVLEYFKKSLSSMKEAA